MKTIAQRELRNHIGEVLRHVERGHGVRITVNGRPVADLLPIGGSRRTFITRDAVAELLEWAPLDRAFAQDIAAASGATIDEL